MQASPEESSLIWPRFEEVDLSAGILPYSELIEPALPWVRPPPEFAVDLYGNRVRQLATAHERQTHAKVLSNYKDAVLTWSHCVYAQQTFQCFFATHAETWARTVGSYPADHPWRKEAGLTTIGAKVGLDKAKWTPTETLSGRLLLASADEPSNWGLFLLNTIPAAVHFNRNRDRYDKFLCFAPAGSFQDLLRLVGVPDDALLLHDVYKTYQIGSLSMFRHTMRDLYVHEHERIALREIAKTIIARTGSSPARRIYLSRHERLLRFGPYRELLNELELMKALEERGFESLNLEFFPVEEQIRRVASANVVVGLGGAGMFNTVFCAPGTSVVDIESTEKFIDAHSNIFASCGHRYSVVLGKEDDTDNRADHKRWTVDVPAVVALVDRVCGARQ